MVPTPAPSPLPSVVEFGGLGAFVPQPVAWLLAAVLTCGFLACACMCVKKNDPRSYAVAAGAFFQPPPDHELLLGEHKAAARFKALVSSIEATGRTTMALGAIVFGVYPNIAVMVTPGSRDEVDTDDPSYGRQHIFHGEERYAYYVERCFAVLVALAVGCADVQWPRKMYAALPVLKTWIGRGLACLLLGVLEMPGTVHEWYFRPLVGVSTAWLVLGSLYAAGPSLVDLFRRFVLGHKSWTERAAEARATRQREEQVQLGSDFAGEVF